MVSGLVDIDLLQASAICHFLLFLRFRITCKKESIISMHQKKGNGIIVAVTA